MRRGDRLGTTTSQKHFHTPNRISSAGPSARSNKPKSSSNVIRSTETPRSSSSNTKSWKRDSPSGSLDQPTLTQIDFVTPISQNLLSDDALNYINYEPRNERSGDHEVIDLDDDTNDDLDYLPPPQLKSNSRARGVRFQQDTKTDASKGHKTTAQRSAKRSVGKNGNTSKTSRKDKNKEIGKHKTLTQMDYVRRYLKIEPDEDVKLEYTYITPKKEPGRDSRKGEVQSMTDSKPTKINNSPGASERKRRKLNTGVNFLESVNTAGGEKDTRPKQDPITPQKSRRTEIPSSQSPESPGFAIISSSQFRGDNRSLRRLSQATSISRFKEESPGLEEPKASLRSPSGRCSPTDTLFRSDKPTRSPGRFSLNRGPALEETAARFSGREESTTTTANEPLYGSSHPPNTTQRTVIYETDAESHDGDFQDDVSSPIHPAAERNSPKHEAEKLIDDGLANDDSLDLPSVPRSDIHTGSGVLLSEMNPPSDASIYYQRVQPATQLPMEPLPELNTQKLAELFPQDSNASTISPTQSSPPRKQVTIPETSQTRSPTQTQALDQVPAEIVPESSPALHTETQPRRLGSIRPGHVGQESVVQVESSQAVDRLYRQTSMGSNPRRGILASSDIITSSVMESVPLPAFWLDSQDSVGEPYSSAPDA